MSSAVVSLTSLGLTCAATGAAPSTTARKVTTFGQADLAPALPATQPMCRSPRESASANVLGNLDKPLYWPSHAPANGALDASPCRGSEPWLTVRAQRPLYRAGPPSRQRKRPP